jgi:hypothetical protein
MTQFTWSFDAPVGRVQTARAVGELYKAAVADTKFMDFVKPVDGSVGRWVKTSR